MLDLDSNGLADDYGACLQPDIIGLQTDDFADPGPGRMFTYLVTAENGVGEGGMGTNSSGAQRPNLAPCP